MRRFGDALIQALHGMFRNGLLTFVSIFVLISCLLFIGSFALISRNIDYNLADVTDLNEIEVFLEYDADDATAARIGEEIKNEKVTPSGSPALVKPMNSGIDEQEQNGVTVPSSAARMFAPIP